MASVSKENRNGKVRYRVNFRDGDKRRRSIRVSGVSKKEADAIARRVAELNAAKISGRPHDPSLATWIVNLGHDLSNKLARAGLIEVRQRGTLEEFLKQFVDGRKDSVAERTTVNHMATHTKLTEYFGAQTDLRAIQAQEAVAWREWLAKSLSPVTVAGHVKRAKQVFRYAERNGVVDGAPFKDVIAGSMANENRKRFITHAVIEKVIEYAPDAEWRLLIALARYGGLRNPSETLRLKWTDINWAERKICVTSPKTKRHKPSRWVPLFPELEPYLSEARQLAKDGAVYCIERYRDGSVNLRTQFERIIRKSGQDPWQRLWQNLRASRETDLANEFPIHVVASWLGNSPAIAAKHYLQVTPEHFERAIRSTSKRGKPNEHVEIRKST